MRPWIFVPVFSSKSSKSRPLMHSDDFPKCFLDICSCFRKSWSIMCPWLNLILSSVDCSYFLSQDRNLPGSQAKDGCPMADLHPVCVFTHVCLLISSDPWLGLSVWVYTNGCWWKNLSAHWWTKLQVILYVAQNEARLTWGAGGQNSSPQGRLLRASSGKGTTGPLDLCPYVKGPHELTVQSGLCYKLCFNYLKNGGLKIKLKDQEIWRKSGRDRADRGDRWPASESSSVLLWGTAAENLTRVESSHLQTWWRSVR
jgi:hypothetical protein